MLTLSDIKNKTEKEQTLSGSNEKNENEQTLSASNYRTDSQTLTHSSDKTENMLTSSDVNNKTEKEQTLPGSNEKTEKEPNVICLQRKNRERALTLSARSRRVNDLIHLNRLLCNFNGCRRIFFFFGNAKSRSGVNCCSGLTCSVPR